MTKREEDVVSIQDVMAAVSRLQAATDALAAVGARAAPAAGRVPPEVDSAIDDVLRAAAVPDLGALPAPQRAMVAAFVRSTFAQAADLLAEPARAAGWSYTDAAVLEGQGRGSMMVPTLLAQTGEFDDVTSFLDVGTGVGWLAVGAAEVWPDSRIVGVDTWAPSLERARRNVVEAGHAARIELREQDICELADRDRFDLTWLPLFFVAPEAVAVAFERIRAATRPGGQIVVGRYDPPPDPLAAATLRLRTIRDGGAWLEAGEIEHTLRHTGWTDVRIVGHRGPGGLMFVAGRRGRVAPRG